MMYANAGSVEFDRCIAHNNSMTWECFNVVTRYFNDEKLFVYEMMQVMMENFTFLMMM